VRQNLGTCLILHHATLRVALGPLSWNVMQTARSSRSAAREPCGVWGFSPVSQRFLWKSLIFDAAYGNERVIAFLFLPKKGHPPYQTIVYFPALTPFARDAAIRSDLFGFLIKSGRAVMVPLYKSTYGRGDGLVRTRPYVTNNYRDHVIEWSKDLRRSIDYWETLAWVGEQLWEPFCQRSKIDSKSCCSICQHSSPTKVRRR
jgi:hypothetical protein